jgi:hypothetical protein
VAAALVQRLRRVDALRGDKVSLAHQRRTRKLLGDDLLLGRVPPQHLPPTRPRLFLGQVVVGALTVPHLPTGIARVSQDGRHRAQRPLVTSVVPVPARVHDGRTGNTLPVKGAGDRGHGVDGEALLEDPSNDGCGGRVGFEPAKPPPQTACAALGCGPASTKR